MDTAGFAQLTLPLPFPSLQDPITISDWRGSETWDWEAIVDHELERSSSPSSLLSSFFTSRETTVINSTGTMWYSGKKVCSKANANPAPSPRLSGGLNSGGTTSVQT